MIYFRRRHDKQRAIPAPVARCIDKRLSTRFITDTTSWPRNSQGGRADFYIIGTNLNAKDEAAAARMEATVIVLPEMSDWFAKAVWEREMSGKDTYLYQPPSQGVAMQ